MNLKHISRFSVCLLLGLCIFSMARAQTNEVRLNHHYSKDQHNVFFHGQIIPKADPASFEILKSEQLENYMGKDRKIIKDSFYGKDDQYMYYQDRIIPGANPETFQVLELPAYGEDHYGFYYQGQRKNAASTPRKKHLNNMYPKLNEALNKNYEPIPQEVFASFYAEQETIQKENKSPALPDADQDGIDDQTDILQNALNQIGVVTKYDGSYFYNGFPPDDTGACSDVIWRALKDAGYDFKTMLDNDLATHPEHYPDHASSDRHIDFRRVLNILAFLEKNTVGLTTNLVPKNTGNLEEWQPGNIVTFDKISSDVYHIGILSDKTNANGVPLLIHNHGNGVEESDYMEKWADKITGHFRFELLHEKENLVVYSHQQENIE